MVINQVLPDIDLSRYVGEWVVICDNKVLAHNKDLSELDEDISRCRRSPTLAKIPKKGTLIF